VDLRIAFPFENTYARDLPELGVPWRPAPASAPQLLHFDDALAAELGLPADAMNPQARAAIFSGNVVPEGAEPFAQVYAGHQFGGWSPRLGDGRALLLGEVIDTRGRRRDIAFKGSGRTPFARGGDGKAAVGPMLREVLISEWMHAAGIPTTRSLAVVATGDSVMREQVLPGAVLTRVAASHLRVGTFEYVAAGESEEQMKRLVAYAIARHYPEIGRSDSGQPSDAVAAPSADAPTTNAWTPTSAQAIAFLSAVAERQARLIAMWMNAGFIHGVMNTDNMTISGETIDYGPCAFLEAYDPATVFSSIDTQGRYAFGNQPRIAPWNLARLAEALLPLVDADPDEAVKKVMPVLEWFTPSYRAHLLEGQRRKLGLGTLPHAEEDESLARDWLALLHEHRVDHTLAWRRLADVAEGDELALRGLFIDQEAPSAWLARWKSRRATGGSSPEAMRAANPFVIPRNHKVEEALAAATNEGDLGPFRSLLAALRSPFEESPRTAPYGIPAPVATTATYKTFCGT
jgi:uncharacterized protein YdiU (UPF0061 family)